MVVLPINRSGLSEFPQSCAGEGEIKEPGPRPLGIPIGPVLPCRRNIRLGAVTNALFVPSSSCHRPLKEENLRIADWNAVSDAETSTPAARS